MELDLESQINLEVIITTSSMKNVQVLSLYFTQILASKIPIPIPGNNCEWLGGSYGVELECLPGYYVSGVCGSGMNADCGSRLTNKYFYEIRCCPTKYNNKKQQNCISYGSDAGEKLTCPVLADGVQAAVFGGCGSGMNADCKASGSKKYTDSLCCTDQDITIDNSSCAWRYGSYGEQLTCPDDYIVIGQCGSGRKAACATNEHIGINCCPFTDNKS